MIPLARITVLQEHQHQLDEALTAYEEALESGDPTTLSDSVLRPITSVVSSADFVSSPTSEKSKVNGATSSSGVSFRTNNPISKHASLSICFSRRMADLEVIHSLVLTGRMADLLDPTAIPLKIQTFLASLLNLQQQMTRSVPKIHSSLPLEALPSQR